MSALDTVLKIATVIGELVQRAAPKVLPWRWGHGFQPGSTWCVYCDAVVPFAQRVTNPPCPGPSRERAGELKRVGVRNFRRSR